MSHEHDVGSRRQAHRESLTSHRSVLYLPLAVSDPGEQLPAEGTTIGASDHHVVVASLLQTSLVTPQKNIGAISHVPAVVTSVGRARSGPWPRQCLGIV